MQNLSFYQKYRPQKFSEILEQKETTTILRNVISQKKLHHAYLFAGKQGVGKTSTARIFAQAVNCLNNQSGDVCQKCAVCQNNQQLFQDIVEIDAASHNGVEEIRNLKAVAIIRPAVSSYKVYIVDEVHMLSKSAFNAFLKLLEEPPKHIVFVLATTEIQKIPETVLSRCQIFYFQKVTVFTLASFLQTIATKESISFELEALDLIANYAQGSVRDALNTLEQLAFTQTDNQINVNYVLNYFGFLNKKLKIDFFQKLITVQQDAVWKMIAFFGQNNIQFPALTEQLLTVCKDVSMKKISDDWTADDEDDNSFAFLLQLPFALLEKIINVFLDFYSYFQSSLNHQLLFEIMCLRIFALIKQTKFLTDKVSKNHVKSFSHLTDFNQSLDDQIKNNTLKWALTVLQQHDSQLSTVLQQKWLSLSSYQKNAQFQPLVKLFVACRIVACSQKDVLLKTNDLAVINQINQIANTDLIKKFSQTVFNNFYNFRVVSYKELTTLKQHYLQTN